MSEPLPLSHLGSVLFLGRGLILVRPKPVPSSTIGAALLQACVDTHDIPLLAVPVAASRTPGLSCMDLVTSGLLHHPDEMRLLLSLSQTWGNQSWEKAREKLPQDIPTLKKQWDPQNCLKWGKWDNREGMASVD